MTKYMLRFLILFCMLYPKNASADVNIAIITPFSGAYKNYGNELIQGAVLAVDEINAAGGLSGQKINLVSIDDPCDDTMSVTTAEMIAINKDKDSKFIMVIGHYCPNSADKVSAIYSKAGIMQILPMTVSRNSYGKSYDTMIKLLGYKEQQSEDICRYMQESFQDKKLAVVYDNTELDNVGIAGAIQNEFTSAGMADNVKTFSYDLYAGDGKKLVQDIVGENSDMVYIMGGAENITALSKMLKNEKPEISIMTNKYQVNKSYTKAMNGLIENSYSIALPTLKENPNFAEYLVSLRLQGVEPEGLMVYGYMAVKIWKEGVERADSFNSESIAKIINSEAESGWADVRFSKGTPDKSINYCIYRYENGEYTQVY